MKQVLLVFVGGGFGSALRYLVSKWVHSPNATFPIGTFLVNIIGSLIIGVLIGLASKQNGLNQSQTLLLVTGFCGGFTTFSAFANENLQFLKAGDYFNFSVYTFGSIVVGLAAVFVGLYFSKLV